MNWILTLVILSSPLWSAEFLYHGSSTDGIECLLPRLRFTPGEELSSPPGIYSSDLPAFAAAHSLGLAAKGSTCM